MGATLSSWWVSLMRERLSPVRFFSDSSTVFPLVMQVRNNLGLAYMQTGDITSSLAQHQAVLDLLERRSHREEGGDLVALRREVMGAKSHMYRARKSVCDWVGWEEAMDDLLRDMDGRLLTGG
jgi:hypothetical protein